jgi:hypothetical protein
MRENKLLIFYEGNDGPTAGEPGRSFNIAASPDISRIGEASIDGILQNFPCGEGEASSHGRGAKNRALRSILFLRRQMGYSVLPTNQK